MEKSIQFKGYTVQKLNLEKINDIKKEKQGNITLNYKSFKNQEKGREYRYKLTMSIELYTKLSKIELILDGFFEIPNEIEEEIVKYFLDVSAPAIIYPYARTLISNITAFDIDDTVLLPILNFADKSN